MGKFWYMYVHSVQVKFLIGVNIAVKYFQCLDPVRRSRAKKALDMINKTGGGPLQVFFRSSSTFTIALLLSSACKFRPYIRVAVGDKFWLHPA